MLLRAWGHSQPEDKLSVSLLDSGQAEEQLGVGL